MCQCVCVCTCTHGGPAEVMIKLLAWLYYWVVYSGPAPRSQDALYGEDPGECGGDKAPGAGVHEGGGEVADDAEAVVEADVEVDEVDVDHLVDERMREAGELEEPSGCPADEPKEDKFKNDDARRGGDRDDVADLGGAVIEVSGDADDEPRGEKERDGDGEGARVYLPPTTMTMFSRVPRSRDSLESRRGRWTLVLAVL